MAALGQRRVSVLALRRPGDPSCPFLANGSSKGRWRHANSCNAWQVFIAAVYVPRKLRRLRQARGESGNAAADGLEASLLGGRAQGSE